jgi:OOP family OmpA-OmpF porin
MVSATGMTAALASKGSQPAEPSALRLRGGLLSLMLLAASPQALHAQESTPLDRFQPSVTGDAQVAVPGAFVEGWLRTTFAAWFSYANSPLVLADGASQDTLRRVVEHQLVVRVQAAVALVERVLVHVDVPVTVLAQGEPLSSLATSAAFGEPASAAMEDLRLGGRFAMLKPDGWLPGASFGLWLFLPTGRDDSYTSAGSVRAAPHVSLGATWGPVTWTTAVGRTFYPNAARTAEGGLLGSDVTLGFGAAVEVDRFHFGAETNLNVRTDEPVPSAPRTVSGEALASARADVGPLTFSLAGGPGLGQAPGTPTFRILSGIALSYDPVEAPKPPPDPAPKPAEVASTKPAKEPSEAATRALAQLEAQVATARPLNEPASGASDRDGDSVFDAVDPCPEVAGPVRGSPATDGCPLDGDKDGVADLEDACPQVGGSRSADPKQNGCPTSVRVEGDRLALMSPILFETNSATIAADSLPLLEQIVKTLQGEPSILRVAVDGHTDNRGLPRRNLELSRLRAVAVVRWLNEHGVDPLRTEARGFGARVPIDTNKTEEGRLKNRRVEIVILKRATANARQESQ